MYPRCKKAPKKRFPDKGLKSELEQGGFSPLRTRCRGQGVETPIILMTYEAAIEKTEGNLG